MSARTPRRFMLPQSVFVILALLLAAAQILYSSVWMYYVRHQNLPVELGFDNQYDERTHAEKVRSVISESPAERAGLRAGDLIIAINGQTLKTSKALAEVWARSRPGNSVELTVQRAGEPKPLILHGVFRPSSRLQEGIAKISALEIIGSYQVIFLLVGLTVLFLRIEDLNAWLLALMFSAFIAAGEFPFVGVPVRLRSYCLAYRAIFISLLSPLFYIFFSVFPTRSVVDRHLPWLKWAGLAFGAFLAVPGLETGNTQLPSALSKLVGDLAASIIPKAHIYDFFLLGLVSLGANALRAPTPEARRKIRVIFWGTVVGVVPIVLEHAAMDFRNYRPPLWLDAALIAVLSLFPLSFAYAVVKHRVLEIPVLLKRSARYVLVQRGFIVLLFLGGSIAIGLFTHTVSRFFPSGSNVGMAVSAVFGIVLVWAAAPVVRRGTEHIDRAFFRSAYDVRIILRDLAEKTRTVSSREELTALLQKHIEGALHPKSFACYLEEDSQFAAAYGAVSSAAQKIPANLPVLTALTRSGGTWNLSESDVHPELGPLSALAPECLVPIWGRDSHLIGMLVLGPRLSEEPYSGEDEDLLASVASQAGVALESIRLAERMAQRMEAERRMQQEMEFAQQVQARLFPQKRPPLKTLEYAGACIQARQVGGDYYDFLELRPGRVALVLADIAGKGISGALLMANLQANLRSQYAMALADLRQLLISVNRLFYENTAESSYATLFFADYDDATRRLRYVNCGHLPPLLLRAAQGPAAQERAVEKLAATGTVLGLFDEWECSMAEVQLAPGDTLVMYTDGVTETTDGKEEEFGEGRLLELMKNHPAVSASGLLQTIVRSVQHFGNGEQADDVTLVVARCRR